MKRTIETTIGIETSCDDTSISILKNDKLVSLEAESTIKIFRKFGGIVPEIAARGHAQSLFPVFQKIIIKNDISKITNIAYTNFPGMPGSLHIGKTFAKTLSFLLEVPAIPINHMMGHVFSFAINNKKTIKFPFICLVASGGHTTLYHFKSVTDYSILNETTDDPIGEVLDKIGRVLKLPYPGGVSIDKIYNPKKISFELIKHYPPEMNFSFSGLKTFVTNYVNTVNNKHKKINVVEVASSVLQWVIDEVMIKINYFSEKLNIKNIAIGGGVSANSLLRSSLLKNKKWNVKIPELKFSGDNGAMIGFYGYLLISK